MTDVKKPKSSLGSAAQGERGSAGDAHPSLSDIAAAVALDRGDTPEPPNPFAESAVPMAKPAGYQDAPAGPETRMFIDSAGLFKRQRKHRMAAVLAGVFGLLLATAIVLDLTGVIEAPGMGVMYDVTGVQDPNLDRAISRTEEKLLDTDLDTEAREALRRRLLGLKQEPAAGSAEPTPPRPVVRPRPAAVAVQGIEEKETLSETEHALATDIFKDTRKAERQLTLTPPTEIQAPNLPAGLTQDAIAGVIQKNHRSMGLCIAKAMKAGEKIDGKMDVELTIAADGTVVRARIDTPRFNGSAIGNCTVKTVKRWRFPRFNGEPVTVLFPYVLSAGF